MGYRLLLFLLFLLNFTFSSALCQEKVQVNGGFNTNDSLLIIKYENQSQTFNYNNPDSANFYLLKALKIAIKHNYRKIQADILSKIGGKHYILGEYDLALDYFSSGFKIYQEINDKKGIAVGYNNIGMIYNMQARVDKAISYHKKSLAICHFINDSTLMATNLFNLGISYDQKNNYDSAIISCNKSLRISNLLKDTNQIFMIYNLKGWIYTKLRLFEDAEEMFLKIITAPNYNNLWEISYAHNGLASLYQVQRNHIKSINHALIAYNLAKKLNAKWDIQLSSKILATSFSNIKQFDSAYKYSQINKTYGDSIFNDEKENRINYINLKTYEYQNENLKKDKELQQQQIDSKNNQILLFTIGILTLLSFLIIILINNKQKRNLNQKLLSQNKEIELKNKELEKLNSTKDLMFRIIAHDLLSPLSTIVSYTDLILKKKFDLDNQSVLETIQKFNVSTNQAYNLLENLLDWAKTQMGDISIYAKLIIIHDLIETVTEIYNPAFNSKNITFHINIDKGIKVFTDRNLLSTVIRNLVSNAIKFTPPGGSITVSALNKNDKIEIIVTDTGVGINENDLFNLFDLKTLQTTLGTIGEKGSGIGLTICKEFVEKANGEIWAESKVGEGTEFHFTIPTMKS